MKKYFMYLSILMFSMLGTDLTDFSLALWVLDQPSEQISSYSLIWFFAAIPEVLLALFIGSFVDRWNKKKIIIYGQLITGVGSLLLMFLYLTNQLLPWHIMVTAMISSGTNMFVYSAFFVSTKSLVPKKNLLKAMGLTSMMYSIVEIGIPIIVPLLYKTIGIEKILLFDIFTFTISIGLFYFLSFKSTSKSTDKFNFLKDLKLAKKFIYEKKGYRSLLLFTFFGSFFLGLIEILFTPLILDFSNEYVLGSVLAIVSLGGFLGGVIMSNKNTIKRPIFSIALIHFIVSLILIILIIKFNIYILIIGGFIVIICFSIEDIMSNAFYQIVIPEEILGRVSSITGLLIGFASPLAYLLSGMIVDALNNFFVKSEIFNDHFPGTATTTSIIFIFFLAGIFLFITTLIFIKSKGPKELDKLYNKELVQDFNKGELDNN